MLPLSKHGWNTFGVEPSFTVWKKTKLMNDSSFESVEVNKLMNDSRDVVEVERGLLELRKLRIEKQLWEAVLEVKDLSYRLAFIPNYIVDGSRNTNMRNRQNDSNEDDQQQFTAEELDEIQQMRNTPDYFNKLVGSMAPTVFGHQEIKHVILLMLLGGVHKTIHEGINLRGDINVCIVGDPSCAKSQFLKYTACIVPRSVYVSGKSYYAAGLTAIVAKEPETSILTPIFRMED